MALNRNLGQLVSLPLPVDLDVIIGMSFYLPRSDLSKIHEPSRLRMMIMWSFTFAMGKYSISGINRQWGVVHISLIHTIYNTDWIKPLVPVFFPYFTDVSQQLKRFFLDATFLLSDTTGCSRFQDRSRLFVISSCRIPDIPLFMMMFLSSIAYVKQPLPPFPALAFRAIFLCVFINCI